MKKSQSGKFKEIGMLTVGILYKDASGVSIKKKIQTALPGKASVAHDKLRCGDLTIRDI